MAQNVFVCREISGRIEQSTVPAASSRKLPFAPGQTDNQLHSLKPNEVMLHWLLGMDLMGHGLHSVLDSRLKNIKSTQRNNAKTKILCQQTKNPIPPLTGSSITKIGQSSSAAQVVSQFRIDEAQAPPSDPARLYHSRLGNSRRRSLSV